MGGRRGRVCAMDMRTKRTWGALVAAGLVMGAAGMVAPGMVAAQDLQRDASKAVELRVDLAKKIGRYEPIYRWFGFDEANYTTAPNGRKLLGELHEMSPVPVYIRAH